MSDFDIWRSLLRRKDDESDFEQKVGTDLTCCRDQRSLSRVANSFIRGILPLFILHLAEKRTIYGNQIAKSLLDVGYEIGSGSLYPVLHRLEEDGLLSSTSALFRGRVRRYYTLTVDGRDCLRTVRAKLFPLARGVFPDPKPPSVD